MAFVTSGAMLSSLCSNLVSGLHSSVCQRMTIQLMYFPYFPKTMSQETIDACVIQTASGDYEEHKWLCINVRGMKQARGGQ